jgi:hypothetical protein
VAWWFLCHGRLVDRGRAEVAEVFGSAGIEQVDAGYIGADPALVPLVVRRYLAAVGNEGGRLVPASSAGPNSGSAQMAEESTLNCDTCAYRAPWPGREDRVGQPIGVGHSHLAAEHRHTH